MSMSAHGARRLAAMAENAANVVAIELAAAAQGCEFHAPLASRHAARAGARYAARTRAAARSATAILRPTSPQPPSSYARARSLLRPARGCPTSRSDAHKIDDYLLHLGSVSVDRREISGTVEIEHDVLRHGLGTYEHQRIVQHGGNVDCTYLRSAATEKIAHASHNPACKVNFRDQRRQVLISTRQVGSRATQQHLDGPSKRAGSGHRLIYLMRKSGCHSAYETEARGMGDFSLLLLELCFGFPSNALGLLPLADNHSDD